MGQSITTNTNNGTTDINQPLFNFSYKGLSRGGKVAAIVGGIFLAIGLIAAVGYFAAPGIVPALDVIIEGGLSILTGGAAPLIRALIDGLLFHGKGYILFFYTIPKYIAEGIYNTSALTIVAIPLAIAAGSIIAVGGVLVSTGAATAYWAEKKIEKEKEEIRKTLRDTAA